MTCGPNSESAERDICSLSTLIDLEDSPPCSFRRNQECFKKARHVRQEVTRILGHTARFSTVCLWCKLNVPVWLCVSPSKGGESFQKRLREFGTPNDPRDIRSYEAILCPQRLTWVHGAASKPSTCAVPQPQEVKDSKRPFEHGCRQEEPTALLITWVTCLV